MQYGPSLVDWMLSDPPSQKVKHTEEHLIKMSQRREQITDADNANSQHASDGLTTTSFLTHTYNLMQGFLFVCFCFFK